MPFDDPSFNENTTFHSAHYFLNQFQSKDYNDDIIKLDTTPLETSGVLTVPSSSSTSLKQQNNDLQPPQQLPLVTLNMGLEQFDSTGSSSKNKKKKKVLGNNNPTINNTDDSASRSGSTSPYLISPVFTNNDSTSSPEIELLEFDDEYDDDDDDDDDDEDDEEQWDQDDIFQSHTFNPTVPGLFPEMEIKSSARFESIPTEPAVHKRQ